MTKLVKNIIIGTSATVATAGAATGIAFAVKSKGGSSENHMLNKDHNRKLALQAAASIYKESFDHEMDVYLASRNALDNEMMQRHLQQEALEASQAAYRENVAKLKEQTDREQSEAHQHEILVKDQLAVINARHEAVIEDESEDRVLMYRERVKYEVEKYAKVEFNQYQTAAWRIANPEAFRLFRGVQDMTKLAQDWWYLLQADTVSRIKLLEKDMINLIKVQYNVEIAPYQE